MNLTDLVVAATVVLAAVNLLVALALTLRRLRVRRREAALERAERDLKPIVLALVDGEEATLPPLDDTSREALARLLQRYARLLRGEARERIARAGRDLISQEVAKLRHRRAWRRAVAATLLGDLGDRHTHWRPLVAALGDRSPEVRMAALRSLGRLGAVEAVPRIVRLMALGRVPRALAAEALMTIGSPAAQWVTRLLRAEEPEVRAAAAELLGLVGAPAHGRHLIDLLDDPDPEVRVKAARALGRLGAGAAVPALRRLLDDPIPYVRGAAARSLAALGDRSPWGRLVTMAAEDSYDAARAAAEALVTLDEVRAEKECARIPHVAEALDLEALR
jgi:HEAT repeat protein